MLVVQGKNVKLKHKLPCKLVFIIGLREFLAF